MIQLTQKGKEIYKQWITIGKNEIVFLDFGNGNGFYLNNSCIAENPLELKALLDIGLIEIK